MARGQLRAGLGVGAGIALLVAMLALATSEGKRVDVAEEWVTRGAPQSRPLTTGFADTLYLEQDSDLRSYWFDRTVDARAGIARIGLAWSSVAMPAPPTNPADPGDPAYDFTEIDAAVRDAAARGLDVLLTVSGAPAWAEGPGRPPPSVAPPGSWRPDPELYGAFARALAIRYSGSFRPRFGPPLPRVRHFQAWNEPNLFTYLNPQWSGGRAASPAHYRRLLNAFYDGVKGVHGDNLVVTGGTAPFGTKRGQGLMRPLRFWRTLLCLRGKPDRPPKPRRCENPARFDIAAHHPITGSPRSRADHLDDATIPDLRRLRALIRKAERSGRARGARRHPLWVTEVWWETDPPDPRGIRVRKQARWISEALYLIWKQGVRVVVLLQIRDAVAGTVAAPEVVESGVFYADAAPKPSFTAVRFPFAAERRTRRKLTAWGRSPQSGELSIQRRRAGGWRSVKRLSVDAGDVFATGVRARGPARLRAAIGDERSLAWRQRK